MSIPVYTYEDSEGWENDSFFQPVGWQGGSMFFCKKCGVAIWDEKFNISFNTRSSTNEHTRAFWHVAHTH